MARTNILNTRTSSFLDLVGNGKIYRVPRYQRDYSWEEEQWEDLWIDIGELRNSPDDRHYMGSLVVEGKTDREFLIIDGQQRLATLSVLALAVINKLFALARSGVDPTANEERARSLRARFIGEKDPASLVESSKLFLNETDDAFYQDYLVQLRPPLNPRALPKSNRLLHECARYFANRLNEVAAFQSDGEALAALLSESVARQLLFILITVEDELNAYTVFETLNARGLELSATDLLKNYLFSRVRVASDLDTLQRRWRALMVTVGQERFPEFLRYHLLCELPKVRSERLFKILRDRVKSGEDVFTLIEALERRAEMYAAVLDHNHAYWVENAECRPFVRDLNLFRVRQMTPLLFAVWECIPDELARVLKVVSVVSFRYSIVGGLNTNALEPVYHVAAREVLQGRSHSAVSVFETLRTIYVGDDKFMQDFEGLVVETTGQRKKLAKYILARFEADASGRACDADTDPATVEHILPENPSEDWTAMFPREHWTASVYRIGNLTLLESSLNRDVANKTYDHKLPAYERSVYTSTNALAVRFPLEWTPATLNSRQKYLASRAAHLWRSDFA